MPEDHSHGVRLEADGRARHAIPKQAGISWAIPADRRLDQLVELANDAGAGTRRNELAAAIVAATEADRELLLQIVLRWRRALTREVVLDTSPSSDVVYLPRYGPGRRRAGGGA